MAKKKNEKSTVLPEPTYIPYNSGCPQSMLHVTTQQIFDEIDGEVSRVFGPISEMVSDKGMSTAILINSVLQMALRKVHIKYKVSGVEAKECLEKQNMFSTQSRLTKLDFRQLVMYLLATYLSTPLVDTSEVYVDTGSIPSDPNFKTVAVRDRSGLDISSTATEMIESINGPDLITPDWLIRLATTTDELFKHQCKLTKITPNPVSDPLAQSKAYIRLCIDIEEYRIEDFTNYLEDVYEAYKNAISPRISKYETKAVKIPLPGNQVYIRPEYCFRKDEIRLCGVMTTGYDCFTITETVDIFNEIKYLKISDYGVLWAYNKSELEETIDLILEK